MTYNARMMIEDLNIILANISIHFLFTGNQ